MQFPSISRRRTERFTEPEFATRAGAEFNRARELYAEGIIRQLWHRSDLGGTCFPHVTML